LDQASRNELGDQIHDELRAKVRWLEAEREINQWKLKEAHERMGRMES